MANERAPKRTSNVVILAPAKFFLAFNFIFADKKAHSVIMLKQFYKSFLKTYLFWMVFMTIHRLIFILFNLKYAQDNTSILLMQSFLYGLRLDLSFSGYVMMVLLITQLLTFPIRRRFCFKCMNYVNYLLIIVFTATLFSDTNLFSYWGRHLSSDVLPFLATPDIILLSLKWYQIVIFVSVWLAFSWSCISLYNRFVKTTHHSPIVLTKIAPIISIFLLLILTAGVLILPIRGSLGVAPINTGVAYFSNDVLANEAAVNPLWKFVYALKDSKRSQVEYNFVPQDEAQLLFNNLMAESGDYPQLVKAGKPNVVIIQLESFAAHNIKALGGADVTACFNKLVHEGILFSKIYAASDRSDKGLMANLAGYQALPTYEIMRYPEKTQNIPFLPIEFKKAGYHDLLYMYGGDIKFKNMDSFVKQAQFEKIISIDDFDYDQRGEKWGVHDQYTFERLIKEMKASQEPYFKFFFTLSSHEPFDVPMQRMFENDYHNSIAYTDKCLGAFFDEAKKSGLWDNTLFILIADHGVGGPDAYAHDNLNFKHIPMLWLGGALAVKDTVITNIGGQTDLARTLLCQLNMDNKDFIFSKNILDRGAHHFAFYTYPESMGMIEDSLYQDYSFVQNKFTRMEGQATATDSIKAKAYLQIVADDHKNR